MPSRASSTRRVLCLMTRLQDAVALVPFAVHPAAGMRQTAIIIVAVYIHAVLYTYRDTEGKHTKNKENMKSPGDGPPQPAQHVLAIRSGSANEAAAGYWASSGSGVSGLLLMSWARKALRFQWSYVLSSLKATGVGAKAIESRDLEQQTTADAT